MIEPSAVPVGDLRSALASNASASGATSVDPPALELRGVSIALPPGADRKHAVTDVDLVLFVVEAGSFTTADAKVLALLKPGIPVLLVANKLDNVHRRGDIAHPAGDLPEVEVTPGLASGVSVIFPGAVDPIGEGASGIERHDQIGHPTVEARTQHRHDVAMVEPAVGFEHEPVVGHLVLQERRSEELEHHRPTIDRAFGAEH
jgi:hypothetical protein